MLVLDKDPFSEKAQLQKLALGWESSDTVYPHAVRTVLMLVHTTGLSTDTADIKLFLGF